VKVILAILDGVHAGKTVEDYFVIGSANPTAASVGRRRLAALFRASGLDPAPNREVDVRSLEQRVVSAEVGHDAFNGSTRARVRYYMACENPAPF